MKMKKKKLGKKSEREAWDKEGRGDEVKGREIDKKERKREKQ